MMRFKGSGALWSPHHPGGESISYQQGLSVQIYGYVEGYSSIANMARSWARVIAQHIGSMGLHNYAEGPANLDGIPEKLFRFDPYARIAIYYGMPADIPPMLCTNHEIKIGAFVCETDRVPDSWVDVANRFDFIVVPSQFCQQSYFLSGVKVPIVIIPHGVEEEYRPRKIRRRDDEFVFYNTFSAASFPARKGCEELIRCFTKAFHGRDDVVLVLRTHHAGIIKEWRDHYDKSGLVKIMPYTDCTTDEYASLFSRADCTVHPSKGEGFGLVPLQSIACETPVIAMPVTGMADYLSKDNAMLLRDTGKITGKGWGGQSGSYFGIDEEHLVDLLQYAVSNKDAEKARVSSAASKIRERYKWTNVLSPLLEIIEKVSGTEDVTKCKDRLTKKLLDMNYGGECGYVKPHTQPCKSSIKGRRESVADE